MFNFCFRRRPFALLFLVMLTGVMQRQALSQPLKDFDSRDAVSPETSTADAQLDRGPLAKSGSIVGADVVSEAGEIIGKIDDLMLDLQSGHVALAIVELFGPDKSEPRRIALPWPGLNSISENEIQLRVSAQKIVEADGLKQDWLTKASRRWATTVYDHFGLQERSLEKDATQPDVDGLLVAETEVKNVQVDDLHGELLGHLKGFAIANRDGLIVYAALEGESPAHGLQAIPLSAFIVKPPQKTWLLDIAKEALEQRPTFSKSEWPKTIERGWSEYVHVLYGRPIFEGVRSAPRPAEVKQ